STREVLRKVQREETVRPAQLWPEVPPALESACLKGLAKDPAERFGSAAEFARVVQQWVAELAERKRTEQERERFFALSLDLLAIVGLDGSLKQVNPAWERVLGWSREEILALPLSERVHPEDVAGSFAAIDGIAAGETLRAFENRCRCKDGSYRW